MIIKLNSKRIALYSLVGIISFLAIGALLDFTENKLVLKATRLLDKVDVSINSGEGTSMREDLAPIISELNQFIKQLIVEEKKLVNLIEQRDALKMHFLWMFEAFNREQVHEAQLSVNDQKRKVEALTDRIDFIWGKIKPHFGVFSVAFFSELYSSLLFTLSDLADWVISLVSFGLLSTLILGPLGLMLFYFTASLGLSALPFISLFLVGFWLFRFPSLIIQYDPTPTQFLVTYLPLLFLYTLACRYVWLRNFKGKSKTNIVISEKTTAFNQPETPVTEEAAEVEEAGESEEITTPVPPPPPAPMTPSEKARVKLE